MKLILTIFLTLSSIIQYAPQAIAQTKKPATTNKPASTKKPQPSRKPSRPVFVPRKAPRTITPVPGRRAGMGSRNNCPAVATSLTALAPFQEQQQVNKQTNKPNFGIVGGLTTKKQPKFWFYVPYTKNLVNSTAEFSLLDSEGEDVYRKENIALPTKPGVIGISLPPSKSLEINQTYRWYFKLRCNAQKTSLPVYVEGDIQRINLDSRIIQELNTAADNQQKSKIYAKEGIWFDALNMLAQLRQSSQNTSVEQDWQSLLESVELNNIANAPLVNSSQVE